MKNDYLKLFEDAAGIFENTGDNAADKPEENRRELRTLIDPTADNTEYGLRLTEMLRELGVEQTELARAIGVDKKTIQRYREGLNAKPIRPEVKDSINRALNEKYFYKGYEHMPTRTFGELFAELWEEFRTEITQEEFAQRAGFGNQSSISGIIRKENLVYSTKAQYDLLTVFYELCRRKASCYFVDRPAKLAVFTDHRETAERLHRLLFGPSALFDPFREESSGRYERSVGVVDTVIDYLITLPHNARELILRCPLAFFDTMSIPAFYHSGSSYISARELTERFRQIPVRQRGSFYKGLKQLAAENDVFGYDSSDSGRLCFELVTQYRAMMSSAAERGIADPAGISLYSSARDTIGEGIDSFRTAEDRNGSTDTDKLRHRFEAVISAFDERCLKSLSQQTVTDSIIDDIVFRLGMSPFEWHLWMICSACICIAHCQNEIEALFNRPTAERGLAALTEHIMGMPFEDLERLCLNPMYYFDSLALSRITEDGSGARVSYLSCGRFFECYERLTAEEKERYREKLGLIRDLTDEYGGYPVICSYYDGAEEIPLYGDRRSQEKAVSDFLFGLDRYTSADIGAYEELAGYVIDDIEVKLGLNREQWDIWCLAVGTVYNQSVIGSGTSYTELPFDVMEQIK